MPSHSGKNQSSRSRTGPGEKVPEDPRLTQIKGRLTALVKTARQDVRSGLHDETHMTELKKCVVSVKDKLRAFAPPWTELFKAWEKDQKYLSDQVDERSREIWSLGALFVPISFLIFAQAVAVINGSSPSELLYRLLLEVASLTCYGLWLNVYRRTHRYNKLSYPRIHVLETVLNYSQHLHLNYIRKKYLRRRSTEKGFNIALGLLFVLWTLHILISAVVLDSAIVPADRIVYVILSVVFQLVIGEALIILFDDP